MNFFWSNRRFLSFGFLLTLCSTFGQTSFLSIFNPFIKDALNISNGTVGLVYSLSTLSSALLISITGKWIDKIDLRRFTFYVGIGLVVACINMALTHSLIMLFVSYMLLRFTCQGLMCHVSMVSMARYFKNKRGTAIGIAVLGYPIGDAILPMSILLFLNLFGIKTTWWLLAAVSAFFIVPFLQWLLIGHTERHDEYLLDQSNTHSTNKNYTSVQTVLRDWKFYLLAFGTLAPGFVNTGIFFQNAALILSKNWPIYIYSASLVNYALGNVIGSCLFGFLTDRFRAIKIIPFYLTPLLLGLFFLQGVEQAWGLYAFMLCAGLSQGASSVIISAVWAELYGTQNLGSIRSWVVALKVFFTALSPVLFGFLLDFGCAMSLIITVCISYTLFSMTLLAIVGYAPNRQEAFS